MTERPRVSVILPTYNRAAVLDGAIESVLAQTYESLELVVVDGASTDETPAVVSSFDDSRVRYLRKDDREGVSAARNDGIDTGAGELVAFIDSDDRWRADKLERQVAAFEGTSDSCGVVYTGITKDYGEPLTRNGVSGDVYEPVRRLDVPTYTSILAIRRAALERCGGFDESLPCFEDWELCLRLAREFTFEYVDEPLVVKGTSGDNVSADPDRLARAIRRIRSKHDLPSETLAQFYADLGVTTCEAGRLQEARQYLLRSLRFDPRQFNTAVALLLSLSGSPRLFDVLMERVYAAERQVAALR